MIRKTSYMVVCSVLALMLSGCGANYVSANKDLGIPGDKKPVVGVIVPEFMLNREGNPLGAILGSKYGDEVTQSLKDLGIEAKIVNLSEVKTHRQLAVAINKYGSLPTGKKWVAEGFEFGAMGHDYKNLGIDMLVILSGSANNASTPAWVQVSSFAAFGGVAMATPSTVTFATSVNRDGKALYNERTIFSRMGRRDFGDDGHRKAMAAAVADGIKANSF